MVAGWKRALDAKARALTTVRSKSFYRSVLQSNVEEQSLGYESMAYTGTTRLLGPARSKVQLDNPSKMARTFVDAMYESVKNSEPVILQEDVIARLIATESPKRTWARYNVPFDVMIQKPFSYERLPMKQAFVQFPSGVIVAEDRGRGQFGQLCIDAMFYAYLPAGDKRRDSVVCVTLFLDPARSTPMEDVDVKLYGVMPMLLWTGSETVQAYLERVRYALGNREDMVLTPSAIESWVCMLLIRLWHYMSQRIDAVEKSQPDRQMTKYARKLSLDPIVQVVHWRKEQSVPRDPDKEVGSIDWQCRWKVKEHIRTYKSGKTITIRSYVKGPKDKPMKGENTTINLVDR